MLFITFFEFMLDLVNLLSGQWICIRASKVLARMAWKFQIPKSLTVWVHELNTKLNFERQKTQYNDSTFEDK